MCCIYHRYCPVIFHAVAVVYVFACIFFCIAAGVANLRCVGYVALRTLRYMRRLRTWAGNGAVEVACVDSRTVW